MDRGVRPIGDWSTRTSLSSPSSPVTRVCRPGTWRAPFSLLASTVARMSLISVDLPEPETPVTATRQPSGMSTSMPRRLCSRAPTTVSCRLRVDPAPLGGHRDRAPAGQVRAGQGGVVRLQAVDRAAVHDVAAVLARARADVDRPVRGADRVLVVLDDDQRVAQVAQPGERLDQPAVVALVQPDGRLVQHVQHADQPGADLGGQPDALRLAAGERARRAVQRQVVQPDVEQEAQPGLHLLEHPAGDHGLPGVEHHPVRGTAEHSATDMRRHLGDGALALLAVGERDGQHLRLEAGSVAGRAGHVAHVALVALALRLGLGLRRAAAPGTG